MDIKEHNYHLPWKICIMLQSLLLLSRSFFALDEVMAG